VSLAPSLKSHIDRRFFRDKGYAFVRYDNKESACSAIVAVHGTLIAGQMAKCSWGKENPNGVGPAPSMSNSGGMPGATYGIPPGGMPGDGVPPDPLYYQQQQQQQYYAYMYSPQYMQYYAQQYGGGYGGYPQQAPPQQPPNH
jgi:nucleolysin TIA-1/TIAR